MELVIVCRSSGIMREKGDLWLLGLVIGFWLGSEGFWWDNDIHCTVLYSHKKNICFKSID